jgi:cell division transport system ATP-binding protein
MKLLLRFNEVGVTVLIASHDPQLIRLLGKRVITLDQGTLVPAGAAAPARPIGRPPPADAP